MASAREEVLSTAASFRRSVRLLLATLSNRAELLLVEVQEERDRLVQTLLLAAALIILGIMALVVLSFTVVVILWEHRIATLVVMSLLYLAGAVTVYLQLRKLLRTWVAFSGTLRELEKDRECLRDQV